MFQVFIRTGHSSAQFMVMHAQGSTCCQSIAISEERLLCKGKYYSAAVYLWGQRQLRVKPYYTRVEKRSLLQLVCRGGGSYLL